VGGGAAREVHRRGGRLVALSTIAGSIHDDAGLPVDRLLELRAKHGDECIAHLGLEVRPPAALFDVAADVIVPGARIGVIDEARARKLAARVVAPAANVPYTDAGLAVLRERGIPAHADFVCNAGAVFGYLCAGERGPEEVLASVVETLAEIVHEVSAHPDGPYAGACAKAETFLRTWRPEDGLPPSRPFAPSSAT
jgi:glutamate dehydrogenase/leucine dehydrogenase